jgi:23S rRNA (guanosine2251-2'-O)-methyltransferase
MYLRKHPFFNRFQHMKKLKTDELGRKSVSEFKEAQKHPVIVVLDNVRSLHNVGAIFRTADAFLIEGIYLCGITGTPPNRELYKTALGSTESVDWKYFETTATAVAFLKENGYMVIAVEQTSTSIKLQDFQFAIQQKVALILGNEINGVEENILNSCDYCIEIPQFGSKHSFNVSVATGIVLWEIIKKITLPK